MFGQINEALRAYGHRGKGHSSSGHFLIRNMKVLHVLCAAAWAGGALAMQALAFLGRESTGATLVQIQSCLHFVDTWVVIPGLLGCALTGLFYSLCTSIGFFHFAWIGFKWVFTGCAALFGLLFWAGWGDTLIALLAPHGWDAPLRWARGLILPETWRQAVLQLLAIVLLFQISVYRPRSFFPWHNRNDPAQH